MTIRGPRTRCPRGLKGKVDFATPTTVWVSLDKNPIPEAVPLPAPWCPVDLSQSPDGEWITTKRWYDFQEARAVWQRRHRPEAL